MAVDEWSPWDGFVPRPIEIPESLRSTPFTTSQAARVEVSIHVLRGHRFVQLFRGVWVPADLTVDESVRIAAARLLLPADAALSHVSALRRLGVGLGSEWPLHFSTNTTSQTRLPGVMLHRRLGRLSPTDVDGVPTLGPDRTFVDCATLFGLRDLVRAGDWLVRLGLTTPEVLRAYAADRHLDGVLRARRASMFVAGRVDSVTETDVRLLLRFARLPLPEVNDGSRMRQGTSSDAATSSFASSGSSSSTTDGTTSETPATAKRTICAGSDSRQLAGDSLSSPRPTCPTRPGS